MYIEVSARGTYLYSVGMKYNALKCLYGVYNSKLKHTDGCITAFPYKLHENYLQNEVQCSIRYYFVYSAPCLFC